jgi:hypothetical protein
MCRESLPICLAFQIGEPFFWDIGRFIFSDEISSPIQIVCIYLNELDSGRLNETDVIFGDSANVKSLSASQCIPLLQKYFDHVTLPDCSFAVVEVFTSVLADQLCQFGNSEFFKVDAQQGMTGSTEARSGVVTALIDVAKEFATRSITVAKTVQRRNQVRASQIYNTTEEAEIEELADSLTNMQASSWEDSNHLLIVFQRQGGGGTISALYRDQTQVPDHINKLLASQHFGPSEDATIQYTDMSPDRLRVELEKLVRTSRKPLDIKDNYALTSDNMLKMALVVLRIRAHIPVVIMGHSGCGKTSLLSYLRQICEIPKRQFAVLNVHAGITADDIAQFVRSLRKLAADGEVWGFLDEINTCEHLGVITDLLCHRTFDGQPLDSSIKLMACANPYEKRRKLGKTAGLSSKFRWDKFAGLTYRVHPLPESMMDYIWDYGALRTQDETKYITTIMGSACSDAALLKTVELIAYSQQFIRNQDAFEMGQWQPGAEPDPEFEMHSVVSLRDVKRVRDLLEFFIGAPGDSANSMFEQRQAAGGYVCTGGGKRAHQQQRENLEEIDQALSTEQQGLLLALAHCYYSRLEKPELRQGYRKMIADVMKAGGDCPRYYEMPTKSTFETLLQTEQQDILDRMDFDVHPNIAHNGALLENVFISFVCIRIKLPVFVVGKPGNSKSLAMQLLNSSLRGPDSKDPLFRAMPGVYFVSFQGSEDSTSEGIIQIFEKAKKYLTDQEEQADAPEVIPVVLLDEVGPFPSTLASIATLNSLTGAAGVGLAEISRHNPLKVLHSLLEPAFGETAKVAVVGISNWALDAAKMNRAIHLSRPDPDERDLIMTGQKILGSFTRQDQDVGYLNKKMDVIATAYHTYYRTQRFANFHGLRDFYSLVKSMGSRNPDRHEYHDVSGTLLTLHTHILTIGLLDAWRSHCAGPYQLSRSEF